MTKKKTFEDSNPNEKPERRGFSKATYVATLGIAFLLGHQSQLLVREMIPDVTAASGEDDDDAIDSVAMKSRSSNKDGSMIKSSDDSN